jgi:hypothetical protein
MSTVVQAPQVSTSLDSLFSARPAGTAAAGPDNQLATPVFAEPDKSSFLLAFRVVLAQQWQRLTRGHPGTEP